MADFDEVAALRPPQRPSADVRLRAVVRQLRRRRSRDLLASAINQNVTSWRSAPAATTIEHQVIEWLKTMVGFDPTGDGRAAERRLVRELRRPGRGASRQHRHRPQSARRGRAAGPAAHLHLRDDAHVDAEGGGDARARQGRDRARFPWTRDFRMDVDALRQQIDSDRAGGLPSGLRRSPPPATSTPAPSIRSTRSPTSARAPAVAARRWLVRRASRRSRRTSAARWRRSAAPTRCRSIRTSGCSRRSTPAACWCAMRRRCGGRSRTAPATSTWSPIATCRSSRIWDHGPELSRRFRALKIWFLLKIHGARAIQAAIDGNIAVAQHLAAAIDASDDFERLAPAPLSIVCFRYSARRRRRCLQQAR